jgi:hypothetical protein
MVGEAAALVGSSPQRQEWCGAAVVVPPSGLAMDQRAMSNDTSNPNNNES